MSALKETIAEYYKLLKRAANSANIDSIQTSQICKIDFLSNQNFVSGDKDVKLAIWKIHPIETDQGHIKSITSLADLDENRFASGGADNKIIIWNTQSGNKELVLENNARVESLVKLENNRLASASGNNLLIWDLYTGELIKTLTGHSNTVSSLAALSNNRLASGSYKSIRIWDIQEGKTEDKWIPNDSGWIRGMSVFQSEKFGEIIATFSDLSDGIHFWSNSKSLDREEKLLGKLRLDNEIFKGSSNKSSNSFEDVNQALNDIIMQIIENLSGSEEKLLAATKLPPNGKEFPKILKNLFENDTQRFLEYILGLFITSLFGQLIRDVNPKEIIEDVIDRFK